MPRKRTIDNNARKFCLDINSENKKVLDELTINYNFKYGPMINKIISTFCRMPPCIKKYIEESCLCEYTRLTEELKSLTEQFHRQSLEQEKEFYVNILRLINKGTYTLPDEKPNNKMKKIRLQDGFLIIPSEWIVVNPEKADSCHYAAVLECRNSKQYGIPHFLYLNDFKYRKDYTDSMEAKFYSLCKEKWERFAEIEELSNKNQLIPNPDDPEQYLNLKEYLLAPIIDLFSVEEQCEKTYSEAPYGAMIVRTKNE